MKRDTLKLWMKIFAVVIIIFLSLKLFNINLKYNLLMLKIGFGGLLVSNLAYKLTKKEKKLTDYIIFIHIISLIALWFFIRYNLPYKKTMMVLSAIIGTIWFLNIYRSIFNFEEKKESLKNYLFITAAIVIIAGSIFQIQHWSFAKEIFYSGIGLGLISIVIEFLSWIKK